MIDIIFLIANIICAIGTILQIKDVVKNRSILKGYSLIGSILTFLAVTLFQIGFFLYQQILSVVFGSITAIYWFLVTLYVILIKLRMMK